jgi:hypothetical protein
MHTLRSSKRIAQLVLVWFVLFIGAGVVSAAVTPSNLQVVCTGAGSLKLVDMGGSDGQPQFASSMDCPLCATVLPPPALVTPRLESRLPATLAPVFRVVARITAVAAPPLPPRGPPSLI